MHPVHTFTHCSFKIHSNILSSEPVSSKWFLTSCFLTTHLHTFGHTDAHICPVTLYMKSQYPTCFKCCNSPIEACFSIWHVHVLPQSASAYVKLHSFVLTVVIQIGRWHHSGSCQKVNFIYPWNLLSLWVHVKWLSCSEHNLQYRRLSNAYDVVHSFCEYLARYVQNIFRLLSNLGPKMNWSEWNLQTTLA
jgi:hypothetical protein